MGRRAADGLPAQPTVHAARIDVSLDRESPHASGIQFGWTCSARTCHAHTMHARRALRIVTEPFLAG